jgi:hypothetical protein
MISSQLIDEALLAHAKWKKRLQDAIAIGSSEFQVETVRRDDACPFGQWLHSVQAHEQTEEYRKILQLHAEFHRTAAEILRSAVQGQRPKAEAMLGAGGEYSRISGTLVLALNTWKSKL